MKLRCLFRPGPVLAFAALLWYVAGMHANEQLEERRHQTLRARHQSEQVFAVGNAVVISIQEKPPTGPPTRAGAEHDNIPPPAGYDDSHHPGSRTSLALVFQANASQVSVSNPNLNLTVHGEQKDGVLYLTFRPPKDPLLISWRHEAHGPTTVILPARVARIDARGSGVDASLYASDNMHIPDLHLALHDCRQTLQLGAAKIDTLSIIGKCDESGDKGTRIDITGAAKLHNVWLAMAGGRFASKSTRPTGVVHLNLADAVDLGVRRDWLENVQFCRAGERCDAPEVR